MLPNEPRRRDVERIGEVPGVTARMRSQSPLNIVADKTLLQPLVPIKADRSGCVEVVQQDVLFRQCMMVGSDISPVHEKCGIAITLAHIAEDLVVGAILLDQ